MSQQLARLGSNLSIELDPPAPSGERLLHRTTSLCRVCKNGVEAEVFSVPILPNPDNPNPPAEVWMRKRCDAHGLQETKLSDDADWYERTRAIKPLHSPPPRVQNPIHHGCPFDCGPCDSHEQRVRLPIITITSACNLDCPICYVHNKNEGAFHIDFQEFKDTVDRIVADHGSETLDLINLTGGDPTLHPRLFELLELCHASGIHRVAICTNGIRLAKSEAYVQKLAALDARIALSFDSFEPAVDLAMQGVPLLDTKLRCLDVLEKYNVNTTLIPVVTKGMNDHELGRIIDLFLSRPNIRHLELHTITYTGQGGVSFDPSRSGRITMREVLTRIEDQTHGLIRANDFVPSPCAHPLCYQIVYLLLDPEGGPPIPFTRFMTPKVFYECLHDHLYLEPSPRLEEAISDAINTLWSSDDADAPETARTLRLLRSLLNRLFPPGKPLSRAEALDAGERAVKAIYVHSHMDEDNFDTDRAAQCCDSNCYADGSTLPVCNYNVLYREKEPRFMRQPLTWNERSGGRLSFDPQALIPHD